MAKIKLTDVVHIDARFTDLTVSGSFGPGEVDIADEAAQMLIDQGLAEPVPAKRKNTAQTQPDTTATKE